MGRTMKKYKYVAFISYRHVKPDMLLAQAIHSAIEDFKVPKELDPEGRYKEMRVFRDREELTTEDLSASIEKALEESEYLIVICSPRTPQSIWCTREVHEFRKNHSDDKIIPVLVEGEPEESFSEPLKNLKVKVKSEDLAEMVEAAQEGKEAAAEKKLELLAADLRPDPVKKDGFVGYDTLEAKDPSTLNELTKASVKILKSSEIYRIMATVLGVTFGDLKQRQKEKRMKRLLVGGSVVAAVLLAFALAMTSLYFKAVQAERLATQESAMMTLKSADQASKDGNRVLSLLVADAAMSRVDPKMEAYPKLKANYLRVLNESLLKPKYTATQTIDNSLLHGAYGYSAKYKQLLVGGEDKTLKIHNVINGALLVELPLPAQPVAIGLDNGGDMGLVCLNDGSVQRLDLKTRKFTPFHKAAQGYYQQVVEIDKDRVILSKGTGDIAILDLASGKILNEIKLYKEGNSKDLALAVYFSQDLSSYFLFKLDGSFRQHDAKTNAVIKEYMPATPEANDYWYSTISKDRSLIAYHNNTTLYILNTVTGKLVQTTDSVSGSGRLAFRPDNKVVMLVKNSMNGGVGMWTTADAKPYRFLLKGEAGEVLGVSQDGKKVAVGFKDDRRVGVYEFDDREESLYMSEGAAFGDEIVKTQFYNDDSIILASSRDGTIKILSSNSKIQEQKVKGSFIGLSRNQMKALVLEAVEGSEGLNKKIKVFDFATGQETVLGTMNSVYLRDINYSDVTNDGQRIAMSQGRIVDIMSDKGELIGNTNSHDQTHATAIVVDVKFGADGAFLYSLGEGGDVLKSHGSTGVLVQSYYPKKKAAHSFLLSDDDSLLAINYMDETSVVLDSKSGQVVQELKGKSLLLQGEGGKLSKVVGQDGKILFEWQNEKIKQYASNEERLPRADRYEAFNQVSQNGNYLITTNADQETVLTDLTTGLRLRGFPTDSSQFSGETWAYLSGDGKKMAYEYNDKEIIVTPFFDEAALKQMAKDMIAGRTLTQEEKVQIGLMEEVKDEEK